MHGKKNKKICRRCLVLRARGWRHGQFSFENLIPVAIVGQKEVVLVGEDNLTLRDTLRRSRQAKALKCLSTSRNRFYQHEFDFQVDDLIWM